MKRAVRVVTLLLSLCSAGCGLDLGFAGGRTFPQKAWSGSTHVAVSTKASSPLNSQGLLVGAEAEGRSEEDFGARWTAGARVGYGKSSDARPLAMGWEAHGDFGTTIRDGRIFPRGDLYMGATAALTIWLSQGHQLQDLNTSTWVGVRAVELVPYTRVRRYIDHADDGSSTDRWDLGFGFAFRLRTLSDVL